MEKDKQNITRERRPINLCYYLQLKRSKVNADSDPPDPAEVVSGAAAWTLPSTHAGGQDDLSSQQARPNYEYNSYYCDHYCN